MRAVKPKAVEAPSEEPWFWGNNRGGGGAPLKDQSGVPLANLRDVIKGNVQADHSPTRSPIKSRSNRYDSDEDDYNDRDRDRRVRSPPVVRGLENHYSNRRVQEPPPGPVVDREKEQKIRFVLRDLFRFIF